MAIGQYVPVSLPSTLVVQAGTSSIYRCPWFKPHTAIGDSDRELMLTYFLHLFPLGLLHAMIWHCKITQVRPNIGIWKYRRWKASETSESLCQQQSKSPEKNFLKRKTCKPFLYCCPCLPLYFILHKRLNHTPTSVTKTRKCFIALKRMAKKSCWWHITLLSISFSMQQFSNSMSLNFAQELGMTKYQNPTKITSSVKMYFAFSRDHTQETDCHSRIIVFLNFLKSTSKTAETEKFITVENYMNRKYTCGYWSSIHVWHSNAISITLLDRIAP